jgi:flagellar motility protein MotE (MotC chaperone)
MKTGYETHFKKMKKNTRFQVKSNSSPAANRPEPIKIQKRKKKQSFPLMSLMITVCILGGATYGYMNPEQVEQYVGNIEIGFLGESFAQSAPAAKQKLPADSKKVETSADGKSLEAKSKTTSATGLTPEEVALFNSLEDRKKQLDAKEADLKKLEEELHNQKVELEKRLGQLEQLRTQIGNQLQERVNTDAEQVDKLVSFYSSMKPQTAAKVIEKLNEDLAVEVLKKMKKKEAAEIMNMIESEKAQRLSEKFAGYKK